MSIQNLQLLPLIMHIDAFFVRFYSIEHKICIFLKILKKVRLKRPLASYAHKKYISIIYQVSTQHEKFLRFQAIEFEKEEESREFGE